LPENHGQRIATSMAGNERQLDTREAAGNVSPMAQQRGPHRNPGTAQLARLALLRERERASTHHADVASKQVRGGLSPDNARERTPAHRSDAISIANRKPADQAQVRSALGDILFERAKTSTQLQYRPDIDGLRALAVIPVLLYHAGVAPFAGGYVGVDVFFVISGYLIASITFEDVRKGRFSILKFYERRIRRIFPALFAVLLACFVVGSFLLMPADFRRLGATIAAASVSASNILFAQQAGYFDTGADTNPLMHTWSLAVEEQYYLVFPIFMAGMQLARARVLLVSLIALFTLSFAWSVFQLSYDATGAFYLPGGRAWELLLGAIIGVHRQMTRFPRWLTELLGAGGVCLILWSVFTYSVRTPFPGAYALVPCLGAALIIYSGSLHRTAISRLLSLRILMFIGVISYSLYLWHWPMLGVTKYYLMREITVPEASLVLLASVGVAFLSWRYVEMPFRRGGTFGNARRRTLFAVATGVVMLSVAAGAAIHLSNGWPQRLPADVSSLAMGALDTAARKSPCNAVTPAEIVDGRACELGSASSGAAPSFAVFGDSIGTSLLPAIDAVATEHHRKGVNLTRGGCYPLVGISQSSDPPEHRRACSEFVKASIDYIEAHPTITAIIVVGRWTSAAEGTRFGASMIHDWYITDDESPSAGYAENRNVFVRGLTRAVDAFRGRSVFVVTSVPEQKVDVPRVAALARYLGRDVAFDLDRSEFDRRQQFVSATLTGLSDRLGFTILDLGRSFCTARRCMATRGDLSLYSDDNHLSRYGALSVKHAFEPVFAPK
jgi:peptidoglycan/LPS O-acetylase OafA/YrhL